MRPIAMVMLPCPDATLARAARRSIVVNGVKANRADLAVALAVSPTSSGVSSWAQILSRRLCKGAYTGGVIRETFTQLRYPFIGTTPCSVP